MIYDIRSLTKVVITYIFLYASVCTYIHIAMYVCSNQLSSCVLFSTACQNEFSGGLFWVNSRRGTHVSQPCSELHSSFRFGVSISRLCRADGSWSPVDLRNCTMFRDSNPAVVVYFTTNLNNTVMPNNVSSYIIV